MIMEGLNVMAQMRKNFRLKMLSAFMCSLMSGTCLQSFAASGVDLTITGTVNEGTCTLALDQSTLKLNAIDSSSSLVNETTPLSGQEITLTVSQCSPGQAAHAPSLKFSGSTYDKLWRDTKSDNADNNAGKAYGFLIKETSDVIKGLGQDKLVSNGDFAIGDKGSFLTNNQSIKFLIGYGKSKSSTDVYAGGLKSSVNISFEYR